MFRPELPLIVHVIHRLDIGGLENGLVNLINNLSREKYRHAIICMTESSKFRERIKDNNVAIYELHKREGKDFRIYFRLWKLFRRLKPAIVHTRNVAALEASIVATLAGVSIRIHGEHGRDIFELNGNIKKYHILRQVCMPFIQNIIALSKNLEKWLRDDVGISPDKIVQFYNGVDTERFYPAWDKKRQLSKIPPSIAEERNILIGTVGRLEPIKDQLTLVRAFLLLLKDNPKCCEYLRLIILGDGSLMKEIIHLVDEADAKELVWLAGSRDDVSDILREMDIFVLPSLNEGISNTILEAMASGLPVLATKVGGNPELINEGVTGSFVPAEDIVTLARTIERYANDSELRKSQGQAGRVHVERKFSLKAMTQRYESLYDEKINNKKQVKKQIKVTR